MSDGTLNTILTELRRLRFNPRYVYGRSGGVLFLTHRACSWTLANLVKQGQPARIAVSDHMRLRLFRQFKASVVVFCDVERMTAMQEERLAGIAGIWEQNEITPIILNRPPNALRRYALLKRLFLHGLNSANLFRLDNPESVERVRFPCFVRDENAHIFGVTPRLLHSRSDVMQEIEAMKTRGQSLHEKILCEFEDTREQEDAYAKYSYFKVGDKLIAWHRYEGKAWFLKQFTSEYIAENPDSVGRERDFLKNEPYREEVAKAFEIANINYGRIDFAIRKDGGIHVFEINTNPSIPSLEQMHPERKKGATMAFRSIVAGFEDLMRGRPAPVLKR